MSGCWRCIVGSVAGVLLVLPLATRLYRAGELRAIRSIRRARRWRALSHAQVAELIRRNNEDLIKTLARQNSEPPQ